MNSNIIVFGGEREDLKRKSLHKIWVYNAYTEQWKQCIISADLTAHVLHFESTILELYHSVMICMTLDHIGPRKIVYRNPGR